MRKVNFLIASALFGTMVQPIFAQNEKNVSSFSIPKKINGEWKNSDGKGWAFSIKQEHEKWLISHSALNRGCSFNNMEAAVSFTPDGIMNFRVIPDANGKINICGTKYQGTLFLIGAKAGTGIIDIDFSQKHPTLEATFTSE